MYIVLWVEHTYSPKTEQYEQNISVKLFTEFCEAKEFAEELYENRLNPESDFVAILPCLALYSYDACSQQDNGSSCSNQFFTHLPHSRRHPETGSGLEEGII